MIVSGNGVHWSKTLDGPPVVITSSNTKPGPSYTVTMGLPARTYSLKDVEGGTNATVTVRANTTRNFDLVSSCS